MKERWYSLEEARRAKDAIDTLYWLGLIDEFVYRALKKKVNARLTA